MRNVTGLMIGILLTLLMAFATVGVALVAAQNLFARPARVLARATWETAGASDSEAGS